MPGMPNVRWVEPFAYTPGEPFRIMPIGEFKRGGRTLKITRERLQAFADNLKAGRPRWKPPIYTGHPTSENQDPPKVGNVIDLVVKTDGLYAVPELTEQGEQLLAEGAYQYNSPGVLWDLNGTNYADEHGQEFVNVLDHVALTNRPWFGKNTALFSAAPLPEMLADNSDAHLSAMKKAWKKVQEMAAPLMALLSDDGWMQELPEGKKAGREDPAPTSDAYDAYVKGPADDELRWRGEDLVKALNCLHDLRERWGNDMTIGARVVNAHDALKDLMALALDAYGADAYRAKAPGTAVSLPTKRQEGTETMGTTQQADTFTITAEEFAALKAKAEKTEALTAQAEQFAAQIKAADERTRGIERARRRDQLVARYEAFAAVPEKPETLAEKFQALEEANAELFTFFDGLLAAMDTQVATAGLFAQKSSARSGDGKAETFEAVTDKVLAEEFSGDKTKYAEAMNVVAKRRPDLYAVYTNTYSVQRKNV